MPRKGNGSRSGRNMMAASGRNEKASRSTRKEGRGGGKVSWNRGERLVRDDRSIRMVERTLADVEQYLEHQPPQSYTYHKGRLIEQELKHLLSEERKGWEDGADRR